MHSVRLGFCVGFAICSAVAVPSGVPVSFVVGGRPSPEGSVWVAEARSRLAGAVTPAEAANAKAGLTSAMGRLLAITENYPELRSNQNFIGLQDELAGTGNRIAVERERYNDAVRVYRTDIRQFPNNLFARTFDFGDREYFEADEVAAEVPQVAF